MSFYTTEEQITELFGKCGDLKRVVMGLDKVKRVSIHILGLTGPGHDRSIRRAKGVFVDKDRKRLKPSTELAFRLRVKVLLFRHRAVFALLNITHVTLLQMR